MSELLQTRSYPSGQHPDADQLSAFVENALPEHERLDTLAHLAECANCRDIVALSLPPLEDAAAEEVTPKLVPSPRSGWFSGLFSSWNLVWVAVPALAALVVLTVHIRNLQVSQQPTSTPRQMADSHPPAQPAPSPATPKIDSPKAPLKQKTASSRPSAEAAKPKAADEAGSVVAPATDGREAAALKQPPPPAPVIADRVAPVAGTQPSTPAMGGPSTMHGMAGTTRGGGALASSTPRPGGTAMGFMRQAPRPAPDTPMAPMAARAPMASQKSSVASQGLPAQPAPPAVVNQASVAASGAATATNAATITVNAQSAQIDVPIAGRDETAAPGGLAQAKSASAPAQAPLPSGLAVLSVAARLHQRLALDMHSQLFFSEDDGQHWKSVAMPWHTRAVKITTFTPVAVAPLRTNTLTLAVPERFTPGATATEQPGERGGSLSGAVTDTTGAAIPGATVVATDSHTSLTRTAQTDAAGRYLVQELPPGVYHVEARAPGFQRQSQTVALAQQAVTNIVLAVGQSSQTVEVQASPSAPMHGLARGMASGIMKSSKPAAAPAANKLAPAFVVTTDTGERWTSSDGQSWKPE